MICGDIWHKYHLWYQILLAQRLVKLRYNNSEISLVAFMPNITTNHAITYTY